MKIFAASMFAFLFLFGCATKEQPKEKEMPMAAKPAGSHNELVGPVDYAFDPVSDVDVRTDSAWKTYWDGNWYFFTSEENLKKFKAEPMTYITEDGRARELRRKIYPYQAQ